MNWSRHLRQALISGAAYGLGLTAANLLAMFLSSIVIVPRLQSEFMTLAAGVFIAFLIAALVGGLGGFAGGYTLPGGDEKSQRWGFAWPSALTMALTYSGLLFTSMLLVSLFAFYDVVDAPAEQFSTYFMRAGALFGGLTGLLLGLTTVGWRRAAYVVLAAFFGFALGGIALGLGGRAYLLSVVYGTVLSGQLQFLLLGVLLFGFAGGAALGFIYSYLAGRPVGAAGRGLTRGKGVALLIGVFALFLISWWLLRPFVAQLNDVFMERDAGLDRVFTSNTMGTHWFDTAAAAPAEKAQVALAARGDQVALTWAEQTDASGEIVTQSAVWDEALQGAQWAPPQTLYTGSAFLSAPQSALSADGSVLHVAWRDNETVRYSRCAGGSCSAAQVLPDSSDPTCAGNGADVTAEGPAVSVGADDSALIVYHGKEGALLSLNLVGDSAVDGPAAGCIAAAQNAAGLQLAARPDGDFTLAFSDGVDHGEVFLLELADGRWADNPTVLGAGHSPDILVDSGGEAHIAWCDNDGGVSYWSAGDGDRVSELPCLSRPEIAQDSDGRLHVTWSADEVISTLGDARPMPVIYEALNGVGGWLEPAIVSPVHQAVQPVQAGDSGILHLAWADTAGAGAIYYTSQVQYECPEEPQGRLAQTALDVARQTAYQPAGDPVPYCGNRYDRILYTPGPPPQSALPSTPNGGFDGLAELISGAKYEVLLSTMDYDEDKDNDSPGSVIAAAVADLYKQVAADPQAYPRGMTVRILLGNPPPLATLELNSNLWLLLSDIRDAGVPQMINEELGWRLEVANYDGAWPHSHAKILVVDGKTVVAAGFNMQYLHLDEDHPSGEGKSTVDLALQVTGPAAQDGQLAFDQLWTGSVRRTCSDLYSNPLPLRLTCRDSAAVSDHVPEVMRTYLPGGESTAFSMLRTETHDEADQQTIAALAAAEERIDIMHVQFSLPMICNLNYLLDVCDPRHAQPYINSILDAVEKNDARARLLVELKPLKGIENAIALAIMRDAVLDRGLEDRIEVRGFPGHVHAKGTLIDDEFLIVGSQNYHWSAFGENGGLAEYSLGTSDSQAVAEFQGFFEHYWHNALPIPKVE